MFRPYVPFNFATLIMFTASHTAHTNHTRQIYQMNDSSEYTCLPSMINMFIECLYTLQL